MALRNDNGAGSGRPADREMLSRGARRVVAGAVRAGAASYERERDLPRLIRLEPFPPIPDRWEGVERIVARLKSALRAERRRARSGHWTYDLNRHIALHQACSAETERLEALKRNERGRRVGSAVGSRQ